MSGEGEGMEEARKVVMLEKEGNPAAFYVEVIMESVGSPEEEVKLNTPVTAPQSRSSYRWDSHFHFLRANDLRSSLLIMRSYSFLLSCT